MKPIKLSFSGLHSYQQEQTLDFAKLGSQGVFGIFGPTGSGKSTILDAMTLALYGKVERATNKTQGILNSECDRLTVSFQFELGKPGQRASYSVERSYVQNKHNANSVRNTVSRLSQIHENETQVLADKDGDVTGLVQEILGLTLDDFTRAVVLPQGKFAEFLVLKGTDRRRMLQRLFSLEQYGDLLLDRVRHYGNKLRGDLTEINAQLQALGDASDAAIKELQEQVTSAQAVEKRAVCELTALQKEHRDQRQVWEFQATLAEIGDRLRELDQQQDHLRAQRQEVEQANHAHQFRHVLAEQRELTADLEELHRDLEQLSQDLKSAQTTYNQVKQELSQCSRTREESQPRLEKSRENFNRAGETEEEITELKKENSTLRQELDDKQKEQQRLLSAQAKAIRHVEDAAGHLDELQNELTKATITNERRQWSQQALFAGKELIEKERQAEQVAREVKMVTSSYDTAEQKFATDAQQREREVAQYDKLRHRLLGLKKSPLATIDLAKDTRWLSYFHSNLKEITRLSQEKQSLETKREQYKGELSAIEKRVNGHQESEASLARQLADLEAAYHKVQQERYAAHLAHHLDDGEACPVCGSREHPKLATGPNTETDTIQQQISDVRQQERTASNALVEAEQQRIRISDLLSESDQRIHDVEQQIADARSSLGSQHTAASLETLQEIYKEQLKDFENREREIADWKRDVDETEQDLLRQEIAKNDADKEYQTSYGKIEGLRSRLETLQEKQGQTMLEFEQATEAFEKVAQGHSVQEVQAVDTRIKEADEERERLQRTITETKVQRDKSRADVEKLGEGLQKVQQTRALLESKLTEVSQKIKTEQQRLVQLLAGKKSAREGLAEVDAEWARLRTAEEEARNGLEESQVILNRIQQTHTSKESTLRAKRERLDRLSASLVTLLAESPFSNADQVRRALRSPEQVQILTDSIKKFEQEHHSLNEQARQLQKQLGGRSLTEEQWVTIQHRLQEQQEARDQAIEERSALTRQLDLLQAKNVRWRELTYRSKQLTEQTADLDELQQVLRGNTFVEFIAEQQLQSVAFDASERLGELTRYRYALEVDSDSGFVMRDHSNGGRRRPVHTLSGGETFLTSLSLALSLSNQIQLRGQYPLEFFFLDEGFGTLDPELLESVMNSLENLKLGSMTIGIITHVPEVKQRLTRKVVVESAKPGVSGSTLRIE